MFLKLITYTFEVKCMVRKIYPNRIGPQSFTMTTVEKVYAESPAIENLQYLHWHRLMLIYS